MPHHAKRRNNAKLKDETTKPATQKDEHSARRDITSHVKRHHLNLKFVVISRGVFLRWLLIPFRLFAVKTRHAKRRKDATQKDEKRHTDGKSK